PGFAAAKLGKPKLCCPYLNGTSRIRGCCAVRRLLTRPSGLRTWMLTVPPALPPPPVPGTGNESVVAFDTVAGIAAPLNSTDAPVTNARPLRVGELPCAIASLNTSSSGLMPTLTRLLSVPSARRTNTCCEPPPIVRGSVTDSDSSGLTVLAREDPATKTVSLAV